MEVSEYRKMAAVEDEMWYYDGLHRQIGGILRQRVLSKEGTILDAGCGTGGLMRRLRPQFPDWTWQGVDASKVACELARQRAGVEVLEASVTDLPLPSDHYVAVVSSDVLYHVEDDHRALEEMARVLRPGGIMIINVPAYRWLWSYHDEAVHSKRRYGRRELREKLNRVGLECLRLTHSNMFLLPLIIGRRKFWPAPKGGSDVQAYPSWMNAVLKKILAVERWGQSVCGALPFGSSLLAVVKKPSRT